jgi:putative ABC transport system ATP-binding protein
MAPADAVLRLVDVHKVYPGDPPTEVLHGVDLTVRQGEYVAIVGPSGSGKSTLLNIIGTLDRPTSGEVWVAGHNAATLSDTELSALRARAIGFVFQQFFLLDGETAVDNVADGLLYTGASVHERRDAAVAALQTVGLGHRLTHHPRKLSGGEQQRVAVARALVGRPALLLADEPTGNLDTKSTDSILELLGELHSQGTTLLVITHDRELATRLPRRVEVRDGLIDHDTGSPLGAGAMP